MKELTVVLPRGRQSKSYRVSIRDEKGKIVNRLQFLENVPVTVSGAELKAVAPHVGPTLAIASEQKRDDGTKVIAPDHEATSEFELSLAKETAKAEGVALNSRQQEILRKAAEADSGKADDKERKKADPDKDGKQSGSK